MVRVKWVINNELGVSGMLSSSDLDYIARIFRTVVVLVEDYELEYDINDLVSRGVKVIHKPTPDLDAPSLLELHVLLSEIHGSEKPVLVHCYGGIGRSGTVATAYLMYRDGLGYEEALKKSRSVDPSFVESYSQERILRLYSSVLKKLSRESLSKLIEIARRHDFNGDENHGSKHVSRVLELSIEISSQLRDLGILELNEESEKILYSAAILHDIGKSIDPGDRHRVLGYELIKRYSEEINSALEGLYSDKIALVAKYHGEEEVTENLDRELLALIAILRVADALAYNYVDEDVREVILEKETSDTLLARVHGYLCFENIERASRKSLLLKRLLGRELIFLNQCFGGYPHPHD